MGILQDSIRIIDGEIFVIPSGSIGTTIENDSVPASFTVTCSANTSETLTSGSGTESTSSYWNFHTPDNTSFQLNYIPTASDDGLQPRYNSFATASTTNQQVNLQIELQNGETAENVAIATSESLENLPLSLKRNFAISRDTEVLTVNLLQSGSTPPPSASFAEGFTINVIEAGSGTLNTVAGPGVAITDSASVHMFIDTDDTSSYIMSGSENAKIYLSGSGKLGIGTTDPKDDVDIKADTFKIRSQDGSKETEFENGRLVTKKFGNKVATETTGSEVVLTYTPGTFGSPSVAQAGDILGTVTWEDLSISDRVDRTAMRIQGRVEAVAADNSAIKGTMRFGIGASVAGDPIYENLVLSLGAVTLPSASLDFGGNDSAVDRVINFRSSDANARYVMGVDASQDSFIIHSSNAFPGTSEDFKVSNTGDITMAQDLTVAGSVTANSYVGLPSGIFSSSLQAFTSITASNVSASSTVEAATIKVNSRDFQYGTHTATADHTGDVIYPTDTTSTSAGSIYYLANDNTWALADKRSETAATSLVAVALSTAANLGMLLRGTIKLGADTGIDVGSPVYLGTSGRPISTPAASGHWSRVLGYQISGSRTIFFNPDNTWVEVS